MRISEQWLGAWVDTRLRGDALAERLTLCGLEVDSVEAIEPLDPLLAVGKVLSAEQHPNADRLRVCEVDVAADTPLTIVCGAPNARAGMYSVVAQVGAKLPGGLAIRKSKLRGVASEGMLCSTAELGLGEDHDGIIDLPEAVSPGTAASEVFALPDCVIDIDITPNRGDCFSMLGVAREVAAFAEAGLTVPPPPEPPVDEPDSVHEVVVAAAADCPSFASRVVRGIDPAARSPLWLVERLRRAGIRAIHPVVDITNYVMLEYGQPLHGYDLARLTGAIEVRRGRRGEMLTLLDERDIEVDEDVLVIADDSGAIGLAGIMGGAGTAVTAGTVDVLFEGAFFARDVIAARARRFGLHTDASLRFERGVDPRQQGRAVNRAVELLTAVAGGRAGPLSHVLSEADLPARTPVDLSWRALDARLGCELGRDHVCGILERLQMQVERDEHGIRATPPSYRFDIEIADDLVEEVARIHGYDEIPAVTATSAAPLPPNREAERSDYTLRSMLAERGYREIVSYSFVEPGWQRTIVGDGEDLALSNPISSDLAVMRRSLLPGLLRALADNQARQQNRLRLFELGSCFEPERETGRIAAVAVGDAVPEQWGEPARAVDFFDIKADLLRLFGPAAARVAFEPAPDHPALHPGRSASLALDGQSVGVIGVMHPGLARSLDINGRPVLFEADLKPVLAAEIPVFQPVSRFPAVRRDLAVLVPEETPAGAVVATVTRAIPNLLQQVHVFDIYRGDAIEAGLKSVALGLILQETSRTLTDEDSDQAVHSAVAALTHELGARLRDQ